MAEHHKATMTVPDMKLELVLTGDYFCRCGQLSARQLKATKTLRNVAVKTLYVTFCIVEL